MGKENNINYIRKIIREGLMNTSKSSQQSEEAIFWHLVELMMNVSNNLFVASQGVESGIREEIVEIIFNNFEKDKDIKDFDLKGNSSNDQLSSKIFSEIRKGVSPAIVFLQDLIKNQQLISEDTNALLIVVSSIFLNKSDYNDLLYSYISKSLDHSDPLYVLLMISINKAENLIPKYLIENWHVAFSMIVLNLLNKQHDSNINQDQVLIYLDKLGSELFIKSKTISEQWIGLFFVFASKQQSLFKFLDAYAKNSWRIDANFNVLCSIDNLLNEKDDDVYEVTKLRLSFYRGIICFNCGVDYYTYGIKCLNNVVNCKEYLHTFKLKSTVDQAVEYRQRMINIIDYQFKNKINDESKMKDKQMIQSSDREEKKSGFFGYFSGIKSYFQGNEDKEIDDKIKQIEIRSQAEINKIDITPNIEEHLPNNFTTSVSTTNPEPATSQLIIKSEYDFVQEKEPLVIETKATNIYENSEADNTISQKENFIEQPINKSLVSQYDETQMIEPPKPKYPLPPKTLFRKEKEDEPETDITSAAVSNVFGVVKQKQAKPKKGTNRLKNMYAQPF